VHNNTFYKLAAGGGLSGSNISEGGDMVRIGFALPVGTSTSTEDYNITVENNYLAYSGHALFDSYGVRIVFKNNILHNEPWYPEDNAGLTPNWPSTGYTNSAYNGLYGHRVMQMTDTFNNPNKHNLIEGNRLGYGSINPNNDGADSLDLAISGSIVRYNSMYGSMNDGLMFKYGDYEHYNWQASGGNHDMVYNNTIYKNGYGYPYYHTCKLSTCPEPEYGIRFASGAAEKYNVVKNNIVYGNARAVEYGGVDIQDNSANQNTITNNWTTPSGDPEFKNPDLTNTSSKTLPDLNLQESSGAINAGASLTTVSAVSDQQHITLAEPMFFQDGTWGAEMTHGVTFFPDWIAVGSVDNIAQISSINYSTGDIVLAEAPGTAIKTGASVWLYKNSDGERVLYGSAPDMGAYEYVQDTPVPSADITPPAAPSGLLVAAIWAVWNQHFKFIIGIAVILLLAWGLFFFRDHIKA
jgi:hypothetical protein